MKCDIEDLMDKLERENWLVEWRKKKDGGKDVASVITGMNFVIQCHVVTKTKPDCGCQP